eukprot:TRINITY_DN10731_c0_g1_i1.p1 TRINITY_DN10731_c0_g1~~TRINITY_DN10731_c0_g1_i1.p1  ORF type:complete len:112 (-),score=13.74 TRINITY_DN10731_c0_g1_i1:35-370(-)
MVSNNSGGRPGDWSCPTCHDLVFGSRDKCRKCDTRKPIQGSGNMSSVSIQGSTIGFSESSNNKSRPGDWNCPTCHDLVFGCRDKCRKCGTGKPIQGSDNMCSSRFNQGILF